MNRRTSELQYFGLIYAFLLAIQWSGMECATKELPFPLIRENIIEKSEI